MDLLYKSLVVELTPILHIINSIMFNPLRINNNIYTWGSRLKWYFKWNNYVFQTSPTLYTKPCIY